MAVCFKNTCFHTSSKKEMDEDNSEQVLILGI